MPGPSGLGNHDEDQLMPGPSGIGQQYKDGGEFSASDPDDDESGDSETKMTVKHIMPWKRRLTLRYSQSHKKTKTPANKAKDVAGNVNPRKIFQQIQNTQKESVGKCSVRKIDLQNEMGLESVKQLMETIQRRISGERLLRSPTFRDTVGTITQKLMKIMKNMPRLKERLRRAEQNKMEIEILKKNVALLERHISGERVLRPIEIRYIVGTITETVIKTFKNGPKLKKRPRPEEHSNNKMHTSSSIPSTPQFKEESDEDKENINNDTSVPEEFNKSDYDVLISNEFRKFTETPKQKEEVDGMIPIGSGRTLVPKDKYMQVNWKSYTIATRTLLVAVFTRSVLATHSLTGKPPGAFPHKKAKMCLDQSKVADVVMEVTDRFDVPESLVRSVVTFKCADEGKLLKARNKKKEKQANGTGC